MTTRADMFSNVLIMGMGMIGGSIALSLRQLDNPPRVYGVAASQRTAQKAVDGQFACACYTSDDPAVDQLLASGVIDLVILSLPVTATQQAFERIEASGYQGVITDAASTKDQICGIAQQALSDTSRFVPGHPMAGSEVNGLEGARSGLFDGKYWILCPDDGTDERAFTRLHALVTSLGAKCISLDRNVHDQMVAVVSHVPHMTASSLVALAQQHDDGEELMRLASSGFKDTTRIAAGSASLWAGIAVSNKQAIANGLAELRGILGDVERMVREGDEQGLCSFLERSAQARRQIPSSWIPNSPRLTQVDVNMTNHVGAVASVTATAGRFGCNIVSVSIEHMTRHNAVLQLVLTDEGDIAGMLAELAAQGYEVHQKTVEDE